MLTGYHQDIVQGSQFFRIAGPAATTILAFNPDGMLVWSNTLAGTNYTVQTVSSLPGGSNWVNYVQLLVTKSVNTNQIIAFNPPAGMVFIPAGSFTIGDTLDGDYNAGPTNVTVSGFYMDVSLVNYSQWQSVYIWAITNGYSFADAGAGKALNHPVQNVDWFDCVKWSNARSQQSGLMPVYYTDAGLSQVFTNGDTGTTVYANWGANGYRLPTEAEWEKAARGGLSGQRFPWGNTISWSQANYYGIPGSLGGPGAEPYDLATARDYDPAFSAGDNGDYPYTSPVGTFPANGYGLNDMAGNLYEFCWDWYADPPYPAGSPYLGGINPTGAATGTYRVLRCGYWGSRCYYARCCCREIVSPNYPSDGYGFRCVRDL